MVQGDFSINTEAFEEVSNAFKEFKESIIARAYSISRLTVLGYQMDLISE